ncbi:MAG: LysO family transporter [Parabacteroides sp.]|nr:LysO family transporter [Parabacteroides sp.]
MFIVIGIMFGGIVIGYLLRRVQLFQKINNLIFYTILFLLFMLGLSVGANKTIMSNLTTLGWQALLIAAAGTLGSVIMAKIVYNRFFRERGKP